MQIKRNYRAKLGQEMMALDEHGAVLRRDQKQARARLQAEIDTGRRSPPSKRGLKDIIIARRG